jgi:hypothetical protein
MVIENEKSYLPLIHLAVRKDLKYSSYDSEVPSCTLRVRRPVVAGCGANVLHHSLVGLDVLNEDGRTGSDRAPLEASNRAKHNRILIVSPVENELNVELSTTKKINYTCSIRSRFSSAE